MSEPKERTISSDFSAVVLAGGKSSRMGRNKAELEFMNSDFIHIQIEKLRVLGISEIYSSGYKIQDADVYYLPDIFPGKGPLSGIHAALTASKAENVLVLSVDTPLLTVSVLSSLLAEHRSSPQAPATVLCANGKIEPLIAVYSKSLLEKAKKVLQSERSSVMAFVDHAYHKFCEYSGDASILKNCNTPEDYSFVLKKRPD